MTGTGVYLKVVFRCNVSSGIATQFLVMITDVETQREENVIPDKHLHPRLLARVDGHDVPINYGLGSTGSSSDEIRMDLRRNNIVQNTRRKKERKRKKNTLKIALSLKSRSGRFLRGNSRVV